MDAMTDRNAKIIVAWNRAKELYADEYDRVLFLATALRGMFRDPLIDELKKVERLSDQRAGRIEELENTIAVMMEIKTKQG